MRTAGELRRQPRRVTIVIPVSESATYSLVVVPNWLTEFRQHMAASRR